MRYGPYETVERPLGQGGMGVVYKARHTVLGTTACVKLLLPEYTRNPQVVERFINEARAAAKLDHEHIVGVLDCNQTADGSWYIVLEYLEGVPLSKWLRGGADHGVAPRINSANGTGTTDLVQAARILVQVASALHAAHQVGIVHRDVKPDNVFLVARRSAGRDNDLHAVLLDFGIAKLRSEGAELTGTGAVLGTPAYMAPEQIGSAKIVDRRADIYALGAILYRMVTGWYPWADEQNQVPALSEIYRRQTSEAAPDPRVKNPALTQDLAQVVRWALACDPRDRWPSAPDFARALVEALRRGGTMPADLDLLQTYAPDLWDPTDPLTDRRLAAPPARLENDKLWRPPASAVSNGVPDREIVAGPDESTRALRPPPPEPSETTLGLAAAQSEPAPFITTPFPRPRSSARRMLLGALVGASAAGLIVAAVALVSGGGGKRRPAATASTAQQQDKDGGSGMVTSSGAPSADQGLAPTGLGAGSGPNEELGPGQTVAQAIAPSVDATPTAPQPPVTTMSVAILTEPAGAAVFVDDELIGTSPTKASLVPGRSVRIRAELPGRIPTEVVHVVAERPGTVHLALPIATTAGDSTPRGSGARSQSGSHPGDRSHQPAGGSGSGAKPFDPEHLGE